MGPVIVCDHCGKEIENARHGNVVWNQDQPGEYKDVAFTHKQCDRAFDRDRSLQSTELSALPIQIAANLHMDVEPAETDRPGVAGYVLRGEVLDLGD
jgi:hypothetical protein